MRHSQFISDLRRPELQYLAWMAFAAGVLNVALIIILGSYDIRLGPIHFVAHQLFKPLQLVTAAFWIALAIGWKTADINSASSNNPSRFVNPKIAGLIVASLLLVHL